MSITLRSWLYSSCAGTGETTGTATSFRQAHRRDDDTLADVWLPVNDIPPGPTQFDFYSPVDATCYYIDYADAESSTPGTVLAGWEDLVARSDLIPTLCP